jgi:hypothetical protein
MSPQPVRSTLFWSLRGEIACQAHAPSRDDIRWIAESWRRLPPSSPIFDGSRYECERCAAQAAANDAFGDRSHRQYGT